MDTDVARVPPRLDVSVRPVVGLCAGDWSSRRTDLREVCDSERRILVEVLRLDEALEQVPAHGGWRDGRWWVVESERVGMDICLLCR
jgi:hypothetical protein